MELKERFLGCIYGLAIGDALGRPTEFMSLEEIYEAFGHEGITGFEPTNIGGCSFLPGTYTDDTQMSLATARALISSGSDKLTDIMPEITREYIAWTESPERKGRAAGDACLEGIERLRQGVHWSASGDEDSKGCGAAMRTAPVGLYFYDSYRMLKKTAAAISACTHGHPTGIAAGIGTAYLTALALNGESHMNMARKLIRFTENYDYDFADKIKEIDEALQFGDYHLAITELGEGWTGEEAVAIALFCFLKNPNDYRKAVLMAVNTNGDSDSIGCITGAISGAYNGVQAIPEEWIRNVEDSLLLKKTAEDLFLKVQDRKIKRLENKD